MWDKEEDIKISVKKSKRRSIRIKVDFYEVCLSKIVYCLLFELLTILIPLFCPARFVVYLSLGERSSETFHQEGLSQKRTRQHMNSGGGSC